MRHYSTLQAAFGLVCALSSTVSLAKDSTVSLAKDSTQTPATSYCGTLPVVSYTLGPKREIDALYPVIRTAMQSAPDRTMAVASSIQLYLQNSLRRDQITDACGLKVTPMGVKGYQVSFQSGNALASTYGATQQAWLKRGALALKGIRACQGGKQGACWEPSTIPNASCAGPWQFYLPLGLPMQSHKMVMLLHYPPYAALQQSDYLNNATLNRWQRLLTTVGVPSADWTLYTSTVDIFPIAAPGSGESGCFSTDNAVHYFGSQGSGYIPRMLEGLVTRATPLAGGQATRPVIIFGKEAVGYWNASYAQALTDVLKAGRVALNPDEPGRMTAFMGANHPIAAVYQTCEKAPGIVATVAQDLATACFAKFMGDQPDADPQAAAATCQADYSKPPADSAYALQLCTVAVVDKSPQFAPWTATQAQAWCMQQRNQVCPLPDYQMPNSWLKRSE